MQRGLRVITLQGAIGKMNDWTVTYDNYFVFW